MFWKKNWLLFQEKVIDFNYRSDEFSGTNQLVAGGDDEKKSGSSRKDAPKLSKKAKKFALRNKSEMRGALLSKKERKKLSKIVEMKAKKQSVSYIEICILKMCENILKSFLTHERSLILIVIYYEMHIFFIKLCTWN